ncbi:hypothetical protein CUMW_001630 [Citrus unshiu]|nr:hypothetical protein CUMW_001630 [Citrus unshiu]
MEIQKTVRFVPPLINSFLGDQTETSSTFMELNSKRKSKQDSEDGISHLSHPIPCHILSFLPTKHAVATCILSSRWKFVCASLSNLCFRNQLREAPAINNHIVRGFEFVFKEPMPLCLLFHVKTSRKLK